MRLRAIAILVAATVVAGAATWSIIRDRATPAANADRTDAPTSGLAGGYIGSPACRECHAGQHASWHASYHRTMTQVASPSAVIGEFDDVRLAYMDYACRLEREGDQFWAELPNDVHGGTATVRRQIALCTGSHHMQAYWYPMGQSRILGQLPFVYLKEAKRWVPRNAAFLRPPERRPTAEIGRWNQTCIKCHTTGAQPGIDDETHMDAKVAEFGVACEACHGPGAAHAAAKGQARGDIVNPSTLSHQMSAEICAQCHSVSEFTSDAARQRWQAHGFQYRPGGDFAAERSIISGRSENLRDRNLDYLRVVASAFWPDGMVRVAGREYNGLVQTPCFQRGEMSCLSCHSLHKAEDDPQSLVEWADDQLGAGMRGNKACLQCHEKFGTDDALVAHTHHGAASSGSGCYNCHMPYTSYGLLKATRSHQLTSPDVTVSVTAGRPNACNLCHLDKTLDWTAQRLSQWYGIAPPPLTSDKREFAAAILWALQGDAGQRVLIAWSFGWQPAQEASGADWLISSLAELMNDPYDAVRYMAFRSLRTLKSYEDFQYDFLAPPAERQQAIERLLGKWQNDGGRRASPRIGKALLLDANGGVLREEFDRLLRVRDNRPVTLVE